MANKQLYYKTQGSGETAEKFYVEVEKVEKNTDIDTRWGKATITPGNYIATEVKPNIDGTKKYGNKFGISENDLAALYTKQ